MDCAISRHWPWPQQRRRSDWPRSPRPHRRGRAPPPATRPCASGPAMSISSARRRWFPARSTHLSHIRCTPYSLDAEHALTLELAQATTAYWAAASRRGGHSLARLFAEASWGPSLVGAARPLSRYRAERQFTACAGSAGSEQRRRTDHHGHRRCTRTPTNRTCHTDTSSPANILI